MKKLLAILLALVVVGVAFAEDAAPVFTVGMYGDVETDLYDQDGNDAFSTYTETYISYKAADWGFAGTLIGANGYDGTVTGTDLNTDATWDFFPAARNYSFWYSMFDGKAKIYAGRLREGAGVRPTTYIEGNGFGTRLANVKDGILLSAFPVDGLTISAFMPVNSAAFSDDLQLANFGVAYAIPEIATIAAGYRQENEEFFASANVKALADITLVAGMTYTPDVTSILLSAGTSALVENLDLGLDAELRLADDTFYGAEVMAAYTMDKLVFGGKVSYDNLATWFDNDGVVINPFLKVLYGDSDIIVGFKYNTNDNSWVIPVEFEISF